MKNFAKFISVFSLILALVCGYYIISSDLSVITTVTVIPAESKKDEFYQISQEIAEGLYGDVKLDGDISDYNLVTVKIDVRNYSLFEAEWAMMQIKEDEYDLLIMPGDTGPKDISSFSADSFTLTILTASDSKDRTGWLEYYIFGRFHSLKFENEDLKKAG